MYSDTCLEVLTKTTTTSITIAGIPVEFRTGDIQNKSRSASRYTDVFVRRELEA
jgi:hypothetical protein